MLRQEIIQRSPIRILEKTIHGGLGQGNLGVFAAKKGVGKTACLVHFATDRMLQGNKVLHISFADNPDHIAHWYLQVYQEIAKTYHLESALDIYEEIIRNRLILHFKRTSASLDAVHGSITNLIKDSDFKPSIIFVDGFSFEQATNDQMYFWQQLAKELQVEVWFSATLPNGSSDTETSVFPYPIDKLSEFFTVIIHLIAHPDYIELLLLKDREIKNLEKLYLRLDPRTLLIANRRV